MNAPHPILSSPPGAAARPSHPLLAEQALRASLPGHVRYRPLSAYTGAEIEGLDLSRPLAPPEVAAVQAILRQWKVVFFRDQPLTHEQHVAFARQFGAPTIGHPVFGHVEGYPEVYAIAKHRKANAHAGQPERRPWLGWHTDVTAALNPPAASILRGVVIPPYGGDTQWSNLAAAFNGLSAPLQAFVRTLRGRHEFSPPGGVQASRAYLDAVDEKRLVSEHPLVRIHPQTGEELLFVSPGFLKRIVGLQARESRVLLELLWEHLVRPEFTVRFKWEPGSIAFWDNQATAHAPPFDIFDLDHDRQLFRVTLAGEVPLGADGQPSTGVSGDPLLAHHSAAY
ncbi:MAG: TauD/TfdA family dioxygenase [Comamonas sp.]